MRVAVVGGNGQLGHDVCGAFRQVGNDVVCLTHNDIEVASIDSVSGGLGAIRPALVVNASAMHQVEQCESRPEDAFSINAIGCRNLAAVCSDLGSDLLHVSTDYVFDGTKKAAYVESDLPHPLNAYGTTKLAGEYFISAMTDRYFILRTSALYGHHPCRGKGGLNFVELMIKLGRERDRVRVVDSEIVTPTSTAELAVQMVALTRSGAFGLYHATAEGSCSWYQFAAEIFALSGAKARLEVAEPTEFPAKVPRPAYSVLENERLKREKLNTFAEWPNGLRQYFGAMASAGSHR